VNKFRRWRPAKKERRARASDGCWLAACIPFLAEDGVESEANNTKLFPVMPDVQCPAVGHVSLCSINRRTAATTSSMSMLPLLVVSSLSIALLLAGQVQGWGRPSVAFLLPGNAASPVSHGAVPRRQHQQEGKRRIMFLAAAKGFGGTKGGGGGFGSSTSVSATAKKSKKGKQQQPKKISKEAALRRVQKTYGGTSPQEIAQATQRRVEAGIKNLEPHLQLAIQLHQQLQQWDTRLSRMSVLQQAQLPPSDLDGAQRARDELARLYLEHDFTELDLHNALQRITWDASADAKAARAITGTMPKDIADRVDRACEIVAKAVSEGDPDGEGRCLDVGCGFGVLVKPLTKAGISRKQIVGVDLSSEMIRNAQEQHPGDDVQFVAADFINEYQDDSGGFNAVIFCSALHDLPDTVGALKKAASLLRPKGNLVVVHPQGASHVLQQNSANPVLVKRGLPDTDELQSLCQDSSFGLELVIKPAPAGSVQESAEGYLAVLQKK